MKKNGLNVEHFRYHKTMIKVHQHALINQMLYKKKKIATKWCARTTNWES